MLTKKHLGTFTLGALWCTLGILLAGTKPCFSNNLNRIVVPADSCIWYTSLAVMKSKAGVTEKTGRNDGTEIKKILAAVGLPEGNPYCAAFVVFGFKCAVAMCNTIKKIPIAVTALARGIWNSAKQTGRKALTNKPQVGDIVVWGFSTKPNGHTGRITKVLAFWLVQTIEGNTSSGVKGSQRDGGGIYYRTRDIDDDLAGMDVLGLIGHY